MDKSTLPLMVSVFVAAFMGSWHCAMMCGPICMSLSMRSSLWSYHAGRGLSYTLAGAFAGWVGRTLLWHRQPWVQKLSLVFLIISLLWLTYLQWKNKSPDWVVKLWRKILNHLPNSNFILGLGSVFLPCGWLFYFMAAAAATQSPWSGSLVMFLLWLSSLPALVGSSFIMKQVIQTSSAPRRRIALLILTLCGIYALLAHYSHYMI